MSYGKAQRASLRALGLVAGSLALGGMSAMADQVHVTVYNGDLALVKEARTAEVPKGVSEFSFTGVPSRIDPTTVRLGGDGLQVLEQNYRYDLVSREKLLERYLDKSCRIVTKHDKLHEGILKTATGTVVLETSDGVVMLNNDEIADITFPEIPEGLITRPTLVWQLDNGGATQRDLEIAYLTAGLEWHAEYVAAVDQDDETMNLSGWVSIENNSGATFENAKLKVVAGDVNRNQPARPEFARMKMAMDAMPVSDGFEERAFFEYHIYDLGRPTTLRDREVKQIQLLEGREVRVAKKYVYEPQRGNDKVQVKLDFDNTDKNGLGIPLPAGQVRVYREDTDGALEFAGEDRIGHTARDEELSLSLGNAFDLVGERQEKESRRITDRVFERTVEIKLRNRKEKGDVKILVREYPGGDFTVLKSNVPGEKKNSSTLEFEVPVPAGEEVTLTYQVRSQY